MKNQRSNTQKQQEFEADEEKNVMMKLKDLDHIQATELLLHLRCDPFDTSSIFHQAQITGLDLCEVDCLEDLIDCGVHGVRIRLKSIITSLKECKENSDRLKKVVSLCNSLSAVKSSSTQTDNETSFQDFEITDEQGKAVAGCFVPVPNPVTSHSIGVQTDFHEELLESVPATNDSMNCSSGTLELDGEKKIVAIDDEQITDCDSDVSNLDEGLSNGCSAVNSESQSVLPIQTSEETSALKDNSSVDEAHVVEMDSREANSVNVIEPVMDILKQQHVEETTSPLLVGESSGTVGPVVSNGEDSCAKSSAKSFVEDEPQLNQTPEDTESELTVKHPLLSPSRPSVSSSRLKRVSSPIRGNVVIGDSSLSPTPERLSGDIGTLVKQHGAAIAGQLLQCVYTAYFNPRPSEAALEYWIKAFQEREKVLKTAFLAERDQYHVKANHFVEQALKAEFWLPIRYASLWHYQGNSQPVLYRLEYEVLRESFQSLLNEGKELTSLQSSLKSQIDLIFRTSWKDYPFRVCVCRTTCRPKSDCKSCTARCFKLSCIDRSYPIMFCCFEHVYRSSTELQQQDVLFLDSSVTKWDPSISFYSVVNWPFRQVAVDDNGLDIRSIWKVSTTESHKEKEKAKYFRQCNLICKAFSSLPVEIGKFNSWLQGYDAESGDSPKLDIFQVFQELVKIRNRLIGHSSIDHNTEDWWWCYSYVMAAAHVSRQQAISWINQLESVRSMDSAYYLPRKEACLELLSFADRTVTNLLSWNRFHDDIPLGVVESDSYAKFMRSVHSIDSKSSALVLLLPPASEVLMSSALTALPWNLIVNLQCLGNVKPTQTTSVVNSFRNGATTMGKQFLEFQSDTRALQVPKFEQSQMETVWWQPILTETIFDEEGLFTTNGATLCEAMVQKMNSLITALLGQKRSVQIMLPMYGLSETPCYNHSSGAWFFRTSYSGLPSIKDRNYATPFFLKHLLQAIATAHSDISANCCVLYQHTNSLLAPVANKLAMVRSCLNDTCSLQSLYLPFEMMNLRHRLARFDAISNEEFKDCFCVYQGNAAVPLINVRDLHLDVSLEDIKSKAALNVSKLIESGIIILHSGLPEQSLKQLESDSTFVKLSDYVRSALQSFVPSRQALALLMYFFHHNPPWALFCEDTMKQDKLLSSCGPVKRISLHDMLVTKMQQLRTSTVSHKRSLLKVLHQTKCGATTLLRQFAWSIAFNEWHSIVMWLDPHFNHNCSNNIKQLKTTIGDCIQLKSSFVIIADRDISEDSLRCLIEMLNELDIAYVVIWLQHLSSTALVCGKDDSCNLFKCNIDTLTINASDVTYQDSIKKETDDIVHSMLVLMRYFNKNVDIHNAWGKYQNNNELLHNSCFKSNYFYNLLRLSNETSKTKVYNVLMREVMQSAVTSLFNKIETEEQHAPVIATNRDLSTSSIARALMYVALIQLSSPESSRVGINSLRVVFNDELSSKPLFSSWKQADVEKNVLTKAFCCMKKACGNTDETIMALFPFVPLIGKEFISEEGLSEAVSEVDVSNIVKKKPSQVFPYMFGFEAVKRCTSHKVEALCRSEIQSKIDAADNQTTRCIRSIADVLADFLKAYQLDNFIEHQHDLIGFSTNELAQLFLEETFKAELQRAKKVVSFSLDFAKKQHQQLYILAISMFNTISNDARAVNNLRAKLHDVYVDTQAKMNNSLSWLARHVCLNPNNWLMKKISVVGPLYNIQDATMASVFELADVKLSMACQLLFCGSDCMTLSRVMLLLAKINELTKEVLNLQHKIQQSDSSSRLRLATTHLKALKVIFSAATELYMTLIGTLMLLVPNKVETHHDVVIAAHDVNRYFGDVMRSFFGCSRVMVVTTFEIVVHAQLKAEHRHHFIGFAGYWLCGMVNLTNTFYNLSEWLSPNDRSWNIAIDVLIDLTESWNSFEHILHNNGSLMRAISKTVESTSWCKKNSPALYFKDCDLCSVIERICASRGETAERVEMIKNHLLATPVNNNIRLYTHLHSALSKEFDSKILNTNVTDDVKVQTSKHIRIVISRLCKILSEGNKSLDLKDVFSFVLQKHVVNVMTGNEIRQRSIMLASLSALLMQLIYYEAILNHLPSHQNPITLSRLAWKSIPISLMEITIQNITRCCNEPSMNFPPSVMILLFDLLAATSSDLVPTEMSFNPMQMLLETTPSQLTRKWNKVADSASRALSLRYAMLCTFMEVFARVDTNKPIQFDNDTFIKSQHGYFDANTKQWIAGKLATDYKPHVAKLPIYVLVHSAEVSKTLSTKKTDAISTIKVGGSCMRQQWELEEEIVKELQPEDRALCMRLIHGTVVHLLEQEDKVSGVVLIRNSPSLFLPFSYSKAIFATLKAYKRHPKLNESCTFYVAFFPWQVEAVYVQRIISTNKRLTLKAIHIPLPEVKTTVVKQQIQSDPHPTNPTNTVSRPHHTVSSVKSLEIIKVQQVVDDSKPVIATPVVAKSAALPESASISTCTTDSPCKSSRSSSPELNNTKPPAPTPTPTPAPAPSPSPCKVTSSTTVWGSGKSLTFVNDTNKVNAIKRQVAHTAATSPSTTSLKHTEDNKQQGISVKSLYESFPASYNFDYESFSDLYQFDSSDGCMLRHMTLSELYGAPTVTEETQEVSSMEEVLYDKTTGILKVPPKLQSLIYGNIVSILDKNNCLNDTTIMYRFKSPYKHLSGEIPESCNLIAIPNYIPGAGYCLRRCDDDKATVTLASQKKRPWIRLLIKQAASVIFSESTSKTKIVTSYGSAQPIESLSHQFMTSTTDVNEQAIPNDSPASFHQRFFFLWNIHSLSLMTIREGLLVLVADKETNNEGNWRKLSLAVLYYPDMIEKDVVEDELKETWQRCYQRMKGCDYNRFMKYQLSPQRPSSLVKFTLSSMSARMTEDINVLSKTTVVIPPNASAVATATTTTAAAAAAKTTSATAASTLDSTITTGLTSISLSLVGKEFTKNAWAPSPLTTVKPKVNSETASVSSLSSEDSNNASQTSRRPSDDGSNNDPEGQWDAVSSKSNSSSFKSKNKTCPQREACPHKLGCFQGPQCMKIHSKEDMKVFRCFTNAEDRRQYKFSYCHVPNCPHGAMNCHHYHKNDTKEKKKKFCVKCLQANHHLAEDCKKK